MFLHAQKETLNFTHRMSVFCPPAHCASQRESCGETFQDVTSALRLMACDTEELDQNNGTNNEEILQLCFPLPPSQYFGKYTDSNVKDGTAPLPPKVINGTYSTFGDTFDTNEEIIRPLETQGIPRLYSSEDNYDILCEMKKINHSILVNFLELLDSLVDSDSQNERELKLEDINLLFINLHHLINEFRPHQARETLRVMLQRQKIQKQEAAEKLIRHIEKTKAIIRNCQTNLINKSSTNFQQPQQQSQFAKPAQVNLEADDEMRVSNKDHMCDAVDQIT